MSALFVIKPWQVRERSVCIGISDHHFDAFASGLVDDASDFWASDTLSIQRKDCYDGVALSQCIHHFDYRRCVRSDLKLLSADGHLPPKHVCDPLRIPVHPNRRYSVHCHRFFPFVGGILA
ncbi:hypothetical protein C9I56_03315 [Paraburkholderia caribensis]|uniref:hypothetical protein n=1 Tax=Paraburkholderia caribensis TaxID=75105 RepID=UPI000D170EEC|nr:hypothetical protein [Paraburkholderia caribensis]PTB30400.1 hypothetical protein C9I56_03315 [Paraburkholderia caribensis]